MPRARDRPAFTIDDARRLLRAGGLMTMTPSAGATVPDLVTLVAGGPVRGSWWGHPAGPAIYAIATALDEDSDVASVKLLDQRVTFIHRALWPALVRCVGDRRWRLAALAAVDAPARALAGQVARRGRVVFDPPPPPSLRAALAALETRLLVATASVHTPAGRHARVAIAWSRWARDHRVRAAAGARASALAALEVAAGRRLERLA